MLQWNIAPMLATKGIEKPYAWLVKQKVPHSTAHRLLTSKVHRMNLDVVGNICNAAYCTPNDLLVYLPSTKLITPPDHPLNALKARATLHIAETIKKLTPEQVAEVAKFAEGLKGGD